MKWKGVVKFLKYDDALKKKKRFLKTAKLALKQQIQKQIRYLSFFCPSDFTRLSNITTFSYMSQIERPHSSSKGVV